MNIDIERAVFEAAYPGIDLEHREYDDGYVSGRTADMWHSWRARAATPQAPTPAAPEGQAEALGYIRSNARSQLLVGGSLLTATTRHAISTDDVAIFAAPLPRQAAAQGEWISVADRLPKCSKKPDSLGVEVIVYPMPEKGESTAFFGCRLTSTPSFYKYGSRIKGVTHWMPIPTGPKTAPDQAKSAPATTEKEKS